MTKAWIISHPLPSGHVCWNHGSSRFTTWNVDFFNRTVTYDDYLDSVKIVPMHKAQVACKSAIQNIVNS